MVEDRMAEASEGKATPGADIVAGLDRLMISTPHNAGDADTLFGPTPPKPQCPTCLLPLPLDKSDLIYMSCCGNMLCCGCMSEHERIISETNERNARRNTGCVELDFSCVLCRAPFDCTEEEERLRIEKRMESDDAVAIFVMSTKYSTGDGVPMDEHNSFKLCLRSADLGCAEACAVIAGHYRSGRVIKKDKKKEVEYLEKAAKNGHVKARNQLGLIELKSGNVGLAIKHLLISAGAGYQDSLDSLKAEYKEGNVSKDVFANALRSFQAAREEERSKERDRWAEEKDDLSDC